MKPLISLFAGLFLFAASVLASAQQSTEAGMGFETTLDKHLNAITNRNLQDLLETVTEDEQLTLIFPGGTTWHTRQQYVDFHVAWFADHGWSMKMEVVSRQVRGDYAVALVRTTYSDEAGPRQAMLALHFVKTDNAWRLVFDQNTRITEA